MGTCYTRRWSQGWWHTTAMPALGKVVSLRLVWIYTLDLCPKQKEGRGESTCFASGFHFTVPEIFSVFEKFYN